MKNINKEWKLQSLAFNDDLSDAIQQQHHAAQFIALIGHHLIPKKADDSNTYMEYMHGNDLLLSNALPNGLRVALHLTDLSISILDKENNYTNRIPLEGKTKQEVFDKLKQNLSDLGLDITGFKNELHYEIPPHILDKGAVFSVKDENYFIENTIYRQNAKIVLNEIAQVFKQIEPIRIWPHHFDTGAFFVISKNEQKEASQTIGIGFAIPDSMVNEPYYYLSFWSDKPIEGLDKLPILDAGEWMMPNWNGSILKHSDILKAGSAGEQHGLVKSFYNSGINLLMEHF